MKKRIDLLDRQEFINNTLKLINQLSEIKKGSSFAIEGSWGIGKTFVIEELEKKLEEVKYDEDTNRYFVFHYNAWQYDYYEEPVVAIISAMLSSIREDEALVDEGIEDCVKAGYEFVAEKFKEIAGVYLENKIGVNLISWADDIEKTKKDNEKTLHKFDKKFNFNKTMEKVRKSLKQIAEKRTVVLVVDELDRCIPTYAIKVLERVHHIFYGLENIIVIMTMDRKQLEFSIEKMFGVAKGEVSTTVEKYLKKFIDFSLILENGIVNESFAEKYKFYFDKFNIDENIGMDPEGKLAILLEGIDIRRQEKIIEKAYVVHSIVCSETVDISVLFFEIMYEVLKLMKVENMGWVVKVNTAHYVEIERKIGKAKMEVIKGMDKAAHNSSLKTRTSQYKQVNNNFYGRVFWYFAEICREEENYYVDYKNYMEKIQKELDVVKKYSEYCEIIK